MFCFVFMLFCCLHSSDRQTDSQSVTIIGFSIEEEEKKKRVKNRKKRKESRRMSETDNAKRKVKLGRKWMSRVNNLLDEGGVLGKEEEKEYSPLSYLLFPSLSHSFLYAFRFTLTSVICCNWLVPANFSIYLSRKCARIHTHTRL